MRRDILHPGAGELRYEIREIVGFAKSLGKWNIPIHWENIGDPIQKGEPVADWIKDIVREKAGENLSYAYSETEGVRSTREFLSELANRRTVLEPQARTRIPRPAPQSKRRTFFFLTASATRWRKFSASSAGKRAFWGPPPRTPPCLPRKPPIPATSI